MLERETNELSLQIYRGVSRRSSELDYYKFRRALRSRVSLNVFVCDALHLESPRTSARLLPVPNVTPATSRRDTPCPLEVPARQAN